MTVMGSCNFCGQTQMIELPDFVSESNAAEEANFRATIECKCKQGADWRSNRLVIEKCSDNIEMMFREKYPEIADVLQDAKDLVYSGDIKKITCITPESGSAAMYKKGGSIEVKFTQKHETVMSAEW